MATDARRFGSPLSMAAAHSAAQQWWTAANVVQVHTTDATVVQFLDWLKAFSLGRKRLLDTLLAATLSKAGITSILTTNPADFTLLGFACVAP